MQDTNKDKTIAVIAGNIANEFCRDLVESIRNAIPPTGGINIAVLPGEVLIRGKRTENNWQYDAVFNGIYSLGYQCEIDGIIVFGGSMGWIVDEKDFKEFLDSFKDIPKVVLTSSLEDQITINYDNESGIKEAIDYLVNVNGFTKICMLGGVESNLDAGNRKEIFIKCLEENGLPFREEQYENTNMSTHTEQQAEKLLNNNPGVEAIFCVNDTAAVGLYNVMKSRELIPGEDIMVFGFDNTRMASEMIPSLSSVGADEITLGKKAVQILIDMMNGQEVESAKVKTRLYGRQSLPYEMYQYTNRELLDANEAFIYRMFDDCFYRYKAASIKSSSVNLRRLYFEFISKILKAYKNKYMPYEDYEDVERMVDVFFANGAMEYTDAEKLIDCMSRLQYAINALKGSPAVISMINNLFIRMRDACIREICKTNTAQRNSSFSNIKRMREHLVIGMDYAGDKEKVLLTYIKNLGLEGIENGSLFMFDEPVVREEYEVVTYPDEILLKCIIKDGDVYLTPADRQRKKTKDILKQSFAQSRLESIAVFPVFYERTTYGLLFCELNDKAYNMGGFIASNIGINLRMLLEA